MGVPPCDAHLFALLVSHHSCQPGVHALQTQKHTPSCSAHCACSCAWPFPRPTANTPGGTPCCLRWLKKSKYKRHIPSPHTHHIATPHLPQRICVVLLPVCCVVARERQQRLICLCDAQRIRHPLVAACQRCCIEAVLRAAALLLFDEKSWVG